MYNVCVTTQSESRLFFGNGVSWLQFFIVIIFTQYNVYRVYIYSEPWQAPVLLQDIDHTEAGEKTTVCSSYKSDNRDMNWWNNNNKNKIKLYAEAADQFPISYVFFCNILLFSHLDIHAHQDMQLWNPSCWRFYLQLEQEGGSEHRPSPLLQLSPRQLWGQKYDLVILRRNAESLHKCLKYQITNTFKEYEGNVVSSKRKMMTWGIREKNVHVL